MARLRKMFGYRLCPGRSYKRATAIVVGSGSHPLRDVVFIECAMTRKQFLSATTISMLCVLVGAFSYVLGASWKPNARADNARPRFGVSTMKPGSHALFSLGSGLQHPMAEGALVIRKRDGTYRIYWLPFVAGAPMMRGLKWYQNAGRCPNFGPTYRRGVLDEAGPIRCWVEHSDTSSWFEAFRWSFQGRSLRPNTPDLIVIPNSRVVDGNLVF